MYLSSHGWIMLYATNIPVYVLMLADLVYMIIECSALYVSYIRDRLTNRNKLRIMLAY